MDNETLEILERKLASDQAELAANLEALRRVKRLLGDTANGTAPQPVVGKSEESTASSGSERLPLGSVDTEVRAVVARFEDRPFTSSDVEMKLTFSGKRLNRSSISAAIGRMRDKNELVVVSQGKGRRPTQYKLAE